MGLNSPPVPDLVFILIPIVVLGSIFFMGPSLARMSGWAKLADPYATDRECQGFKLQGRRGQFGKWMGYKGILTLGVDGQGFYLSVSWLFKSGHPPLFFPWKEIRASEKKMWLQDWVVLEFTQVPGLTLALHKNDVETLNANGGSFYFS